MEFVKASSSDSQFKTYFELGACESVSQRYEKRDRIGEGTYGIIYRAWDRKLQRVVALKRLLPHNEAQDGFPLTSLREVSVLRKLRGHANVVTFLDVAVGAKRDAVFLVLEFAEHGDLGGLLDNAKLRKAGQRRLFGAAETKCLAKQLLLALRHCHDRYVAHRDVKVANLLYTARGQLKICDFGLARVISPGPGVGGRALTQNVVTLWYRAPELLLRAPTYAHAVDLWAAGCVVAEVLRDGRPLVDGQTEEDQFAKVADVIGFPSEETWPGVATLPKIASGKIRLPPRRFASAFYCKLNVKVPFADETALDLLQSLLCYDPDQRATASETLSHAWFDEHPRPAPLHLMPHFDLGDTVSNVKRAAPSPKGFRKRPGHTVTTVPPPHDKRPRR